MKNTVKEYLLTIKKNKQLHLRLIAVILVLSMVTALGVTWSLKLDGIAKTDAASCGKEEHVHTEACYTEKLVCTEQSHTHSEEAGCYEEQKNLTCSEAEHSHSESCYDEDGNLICDIPEHTHTDACYTTEKVLVCQQEESTHEHTDACYEKVLTCDKQEHTHTSMCYADPEADLESAEDWEQTVPMRSELSGDWGKDVLKVAESQLGYHESTRNYTLGDDGTTLKGYTRYGQWYGVPYGDWCAMYASFCLHYAGIPEQAMPRSAGVFAWMTQLEEIGAFMPMEEMTEETFNPQPGDILFLDLTEDNGSNDPNHVGIVKSYDKEHRILYVYEGNSDDQVREMAYLMPDYIEPEIEDVDSATGVPFHTPIVNMSLREDSIIGYASLQMARDLFVDRYLDGDESKLNAAEDDGFEKISAGTVEIALFKPTEPEDELREQEPTETMPEDMESVSSDLRGYKKTSNSNRKIHVMVSVNEEWIEAGTISAASIYQFTRQSANEGKTRWAVTANDLETILSKYGFRATTYHGEGWMFPQSWGQTDTLYAFTADGAQKVGSTWLIPGGYDADTNSNGYLWYMPKNSKLPGFEDVGNKTESKFQYNGDWSLTKARVLTQTNTHYTISIADPIGVVSADKLTQVFYALNTSNTVLTLPKLSGGYVWKLYDLDGYEFSGSTTADSSGSDYHLTIRYIDQSLTVRVVEDGLQDITKSKTVTYKVLLDNEWVTVGEQDHYYFDPDKNRAFVMSYEAASFYAPYGYGDAKQNPGASFGYAVNSDAAYEILPSSNHNYAADLDAGKSDAGTNIHLWTRAYNENQMFSFIPVTNEYMMIVNVKTGKAWNVNGGAANGKNIQQWNNDKTDTSNLWRMERHSDGTVSFLSRNNDHFAVDLAGNKTADGTNIQLYTYNDSAAQKWYLQLVNRIWNDQSAVKSGSSYRLYLSPYDDSYTVYYLPQWSASVGKVQGVNELNSVFQENGFYTVRFIDKDGNETVQYARSGSNLTAKLTTPSGYAWKAFNTKDMTDSSSGVSTSGSSVTVSSVTAPLTVRMLAQSELNAEKRTDVTVHFLADLAGNYGRSAWTEVGTETTTYHLSYDERIYVSATQLAKYYGKYGFDASKYNGEHSFFHNTQYSNVQFWNDAPIRQLADGAWMVGLNYNSNKNVYCWYVPNITTIRSDELSCNNPAVEPGAFLWKISVYDPNHLAYSNAQLNKMEQWCANGTSKTITLNNVANHIWFAIGDDGTLYDTTVGSTTTTISLTNVKGNVRIGLTTVNPSFTVLYRGNVQVLDKDTKTGVERKIIDTTGKNLPAFNAANPANFSIYMDENGNIRWKTKEVQLYTNRTFTVNESPALSYIDIASTYGNYKLKELRVQALGQTKTYAINGNVSGFTFTGIPSKASSTCIFLPDDSVLTVVYDSTTGESVQNANFYDYDITEGGNGWVHLYSNGQYYNKGINSESNYEQNGTRQAYYIFGNTNTNLLHSYEKYNGAYINKSNKEGDKLLGFSFCSFKMVQDSLSGDYKLRFQPGIWAPNHLFDTVSRKGKTVFENFKMKYSRNGDGYTLTAVGKPNSDYYLTGLEQFKKDCLAYHSDTEWIWSNGFWPMDRLQNNGQSDPMTGASGNQGTFYYHQAGHGANKYTGIYPRSDDGKAHDNMFGMTSVIDFYVPAEYTGPMDYLFYGDDDLWVYLQYPDGSTKLVCDIGGVHSSVGEYVDLRDYIPVGSSGDYKLRIFYTERGLSGSSCYIHYTLPNLSVNPIQNQTTSAILEKAVDGDAYPNQKYEFTFDVWSVTGSQWTRVPGMYSYTISRTDGTGTPKSGILNYEDESFPFTLRVNERIEISGLPVGSQYRAEFVEAAYSICAPSFNESHVKNPYKSGGREDRGRSFELTADPTQNRLLLTNVIVQPKLPATGGSGTTWYLVFGAGLMGTAVLLAVANGSAKRRRRRRNP